MQALHDYTERKGVLLKHLKERWHYGIRRHMRIKVDLDVRTFETFKMHLEGRKVDGYSRTDYWTDESATTLQEEGYLRVDGLYDSIIWWGVPVYLRIHNAVKFDIASARYPEDYPDPKKAGRLIFSQDTSATLHDVMTSTATADFIKGMARASLGTMDLHKILMMSIIAIGAVFGLYILGVF